MSDVAIAQIAERYRRFARYEARGQSPAYEMLAEHIAGSERILSFLSGFASERQQPNLFLAAIRVATALPDRVEQLDGLVETHAGDIAKILQSRTTQTNEPGRCAVLLPLLARLKKPLAIMEVGASAGLCLMPDHYGYDYGRLRIDPPGSLAGVAPILGCEANGDIVLPNALPRIGWRAGLDLNPLDLASVTDMEWLETLVWPGQSDRLRRLRAAVKVCKENPPAVVRGDLLHDFERVMSGAPAGMTRVVFHTAVLAYVKTQAERDAFARAVHAAGAIWISNEAPGVFPQIDAKIRGSVRRDRFILAIDGEPVAWTGPHGQSIDWFGERL